MYRSEQSIRETVDLGQKPKFSKAQARNRFSPTSSSSIKPVDEPIRQEREPQSAAMNPGDAVSPAADRSSFISEQIHSISRRYQHLLDKSTPFIQRRWIAFSIIALIYIVRIFILQGFYLITYALGIYVLSLFIAFLSPQVDPETEDSPSLPVVRSDEFRPFVRRLPEFKFWFANFFFVIKDQIIWLFMKLFIESFLA